MKHKESVHLSTGKPMHPLIKSSSRTDAKSIFLILTLIKYPLLEYINLAFCHPPKIDLNNTKVSNIHGIEKQSAQDLLTNHALNFIFRKIFYR